ncbi:hypothetical protein [Arthrobacter oryzae]|uniref:DUF8175 domain-containing protein n=1 Tax=Arthrobacter oryzae TaxID=409290 RepID=A0A3N0C7N4_9MICC|nr:hypothetical protein [Arthrobacter oryzae]RNL59185.1 hypothetical protein D7003_02695 [Arthrobacter oryzae]
MSQSTESTTESNPFTKPGFIIAAALVVALIAAAVVIFLLPKGQDNAQPAPGTAVSANPATASPSATADAGKSVCGLPSSTETALGAAPKSKWELVGKIAAPTDPKTFGPGVTDEDGFRSCFAKSPTGALYAATNILAMGSSGDPVLNRKATDQLLMPGPGRDIARADSSSKSTSNSTVQFRGFVIKSYSPSAANVDIAFQTDKGLLGHAVLPLQWADGDWKLAIADSGQLINEIAQLRDLSGFIPWSGA